jgi:endonuclease/exonuclease/phosphatase family metal-dependent hydrolase
MHLRVVGYNVRSFRGGTDPVVQAVGPVPDLVLVQECGRRRAVRRFAGSLGMRSVSSHRPFRRVRNAVLHPPQWRVLDVEAVEFTRRGNTAPRGFLAVHLRAGRVRLTAVSTHLGLAPQEREEHARELTDRLAGVDGPVILAADLNEGPEGGAARWIAERLFDGFAVAGRGSGATFPAGEPSARIDYLFVSEGIAVAQCHVVASTAAERASDHRPVVAELDVPES